jgi:Tfp pilus assembly protein PilV
MPVPELFKNGRRAFTLIELLVSFAIAMFILSTFYLMHSSYQNRLVKMIQKARGQQAVRLLLTKMRQELKSATKVEILENPLSPGLNYSAVKIYMGATNIRRYEGYAVQYAFDKEKSAIKFSEYEKENELIRDYYFLGGLTQIMDFYVHQTSLNEQILTQKHKVDVQVDYYDAVSNVKENNQEQLRPMMARLTVYPRATNMFLRIDVPQD